MKNLIFVFLTLLSINSYSEDIKLNVSSCIECYNFIAPSVLGAESISPAGTGLIVFDSAKGSFRGFDINGRWLKLSNELSIRPVSTSIVATKFDDLISVDASSTDLTVLLPTAIGIPGKTIVIKKIDATRNLVTVDANGSELIDGSLTKTLSLPQDTFEVVSNGSNWLVKAQRSPKAPTVTKIKDVGSGTYYTPSPAPLYIRVRMVGGGGGSSGTGTGLTSANYGTAGEATLFGTLVANGGYGAANNNEGGTATIGAGAVGTAIKGGNGQRSQGLNGGSGGQGGSTPFGGGGAGQRNVTGDRDRAFGRTNTGEGAGGVWGSSSLPASDGGGAGGYIDAIIANPADNYAYYVGNFGAGGPNTTGVYGASGGTGYIEVTEYYQ